MTQRTPHSHGLLVLLERPDDLAVYSEHPLHQDVLRRLIAPLKKEVAALDFDAPAAPPPPSYTLVVGTRNYSSWSMRPWLVMRHAALAFAALDVDVAGKGVNPALKGLSPSGLVPCLQVRIAASAVSQGTPRPVEPRRRSPRAPSAPPQRPPPPASLCGSPSRSSST